MKVLVTEEQLHRLVTEEFVKTCDLDKKVKNALSDAIRNDKNFEKLVYTYKHRKILDYLAKKYFIN